VTVPTGPAFVGESAALQVLYDNGFLYDSTILEWPSDASLSNGMSQRVWPYTMNDGIPQNCAWWAAAAWLGLRQGQLAPLLVVCTCRALLSIAVPTVCCVPAPGDVLG
jgi:hypothetical protein